MAARARDEETRAVFVLMAQVWHRLAQEVDELTNEPASPRF